MCPLQDLTLRYARSDAGEAQRCRIINTPFSIQTHKGASLHPSQLLPLALQHPKLQDIIPLPVHEGNLPNPAFQLEAKPLVKMSRPLVVACRADLYLVHVGESKRPVDSPVDRLSTIALEG